MRTPLFWPLILIAAGVLFLLDNLGLLPGNAWGYIWPLALIAIGVQVLLSRGASPEPVEDATTLEGARSAQLVLKHGAGELRVQGGAPADLLYTGTFAGGVDKRLDRHGDRVSVTVSAQVPDWFLWPGATFGTRGLHWDVRLNENVPVALTVESGASSGRLDLAAVPVTDLTIKTGASATNVVLPAHAGYTRVRVNSGAASVDLTIPEGVSARIRGMVGVGSLSVDQRRFPRHNGIYESPDFASAENRVEVDVESGVGSVSVR